MSENKKLDFDTWFIIAGFVVVLPCYFFWDQIQGLFSSVFHFRDNEVAAAVADTAAEVVSAPAEAVEETISETVSVSMSSPWFTVVCILLICALCATAYGLYFGYKRYYKESVRTPDIDEAYYNYCKSNKLTYNGSLWWRIGMWLIWPLVSAGVLELSWCLSVGFDDASHVYWQFSPERESNGWIVTWIYNALYYACLSAQLMTTVVMCKRDIGVVKWIGAAVSFAGLGVMIAITAPFVFWLGPIMFACLYGCLPRTMEEQEADATAKWEAKKRREREAADGMPWRSFERRYDGAGNMTYERIEHNDGSVETSGSPGHWCSGSGGSSRSNSSRSKERDFVHDDGCGNKHNNRYQSLHWTLKAMRDDCVHWNSSCCQRGDREPCGYEYDMKSCPYFSESGNYTRKVDQYLKDGTI